ncbi:MAG: hypothetical protein J6X11_13070 [Treponema sp.]|nr:hypothetical protein [Treponema sp.]
MTDILAKTGVSVWEKSPRPPKLHLLIYRRNTCLRLTNAGLFHYAGNNPIRYIDPDGKEDDGIIFPVQDINIIEGDFYFDNDLNLGSLLSANSVDNFVGNDSFTFSLHKEEKDGSNPKRNELGFFSKGIAYNYEDIVIMGCAVDYLLVPERSAKNAYGDLSPFLKSTGNPQFGISYTVGVHVPLYGGTIKLGDYSPDFSSMNLYKSNLHVFLKYKY